MLKEKDEKKTLDGTIIKGVGGIYYVDTLYGVYNCSVRGVLRKDDISPTVGDYVSISILDEKEGVVEEIYERKNILIRPKVCNIDCVIVTFAITKPNINLDLLNKFLIFAENEHIENIVICINKIDLAKKDELDSIKKLYKGAYKVLFLSTKNNEGIDELRGLISGKVSVFAGPSGVGKSSIINMLIEGAKLKTGDISKKIERGKHTTRQVELMKGKDGMYIVDSPGFSSLSMEYIDINIDELGYHFKEFREHIPNCKFRNCSHTQEPNCAIKEKIGKGIHEKRYEYYKKILKEMTERK